MGTKCTTCGNQVESTDTEFVINTPLQLRRKPSPKKDSNSGKKANQDLNIPLVMMGKGNEKEHHPQWTKAALLV